VRTIKRVAMAGLDGGLEAGLALEQAGMRELMASADAEEGTSAFAQKRAPKWTGR
jgi:enoyl-CoA hydratase/carnithine racemase